IKHESPYRFKRNAFVFPDMETINKAAYWDYQRDRVYVKSRKKTTRESGRHSRRRSALMPNTTVECPRASSCPTCRSNLVYRHGKRSKIVIDLRFMQHGISGGSRDTSSSDTVAYLVGARSILAIGVGPRANTVRIWQHTLYTKISSSGFHKVAWLLA